MEERFLLDWINRTSNDLAIDQGVKDSVLIFSYATYPSLRVVYLVLMGAEMASNGAAFQFFIKHRLFHGTANTSLACRYSITTTIVSLYRKL